MSEFESEKKEFLFSKSVKAGKRTYFFDVRSTRNNDYYLTITESVKKFVADDQKSIYQKHKLFLYKEDFEKFTECLNEAVEAIRSGNVIVPPPTGNHHGSTAEDQNTGTSSDFSDFNFDDLK